MVRRSVLRRMPGTSRFEGGRWLDRNATGPVIREAGDSPPDRQAWCFNRGLSAFMILPLRVEAAPMICRPAHVCANHPGRLDAAGHDRSSGAPC